MHKASFMGYEVVGEREWWCKSDMVVHMTRKKEPGVRMVITVPKPLELQLTAISGRLGGVPLRELVVAAVATYVASYGPRITGPEAEEEEE